MIAWDPRNIPGLLAVLVCFVFALVLRRVGERGSSARKLVLLLVVEDVRLATSRAVMFGVDNASLFHASGKPKLAFWLRTLFGNAADATLYLPFVASALGGPLARPFGVKAVIDYLRWIAMLYASLGATFLFALVASVEAWRSAPPGLTRSRARAFVAGFGVRDLAWGAFYGSSAFPA